MAEVFTTFWSDGEKAELGASNADYLVFLRDEGLVELGELLDVAPRSPAYAEPTSKSRFHASAWLLTHYLLLEGEALSKTLPIYTDAIARGLPDAIAFEKAFGLDEAQLRAALEKHLAREPFPSLVLDLPRHESTPVSARKLSKLEAHEAFARILTAGGRPARAAARAHLDAVLDQAPKRAGAWLALARLEARCDAARSAHIALERAAKAKADAAELAQTQGEVELTLLSRALRAPVAREGSRGRAARDAYARLVALRPALPSAYLGHAKACLLDLPEDPRCEEIYREGRARFPALGELVALRLQAHLKRQRWDAARELVEKAQRTLPDRRWAVLCERRAARALRRHLDSLPAKDPAGIPLLESWGETLTDTEARHLLLGR